MFLLAEMAKFWVCRGFIRRIIRTLMVPNRLIYW